MKSINGLFSEREIGLSVIGFWESSKSGSIVDHKAIDLAKEMAPKRGANGISTENPKNFRYRGVRK